MGSNFVVDNGIVVVTRVCHGYTAGQDFPHCTCICAVSHKTHGILIIKNIITITMWY